VAAPVAATEEATDGQGNAVTERVADRVNVGGAADVTVGVEPGKRVGVGVRVGDVVALAVGTDVAVRVGVGAEQPSGTDATAIPTGDPLMAMLAPSVLANTSTTHTPPHPEA
jgi:hypothetical protein